MLTVTEIKNIDELPNSFLNAELDCALTCTKCHKEIAVTEQQFFASMTSNQKFVCDDCKK